MTITIKVKIHECENEVTLTEDVPLFGITDEDSFPEKQWLTERIETIYAGLKKDMVLVLPNDPYANRE